MTDQPDNTYGVRTVPGFSSISTSYIGRAAAILDSTRLADFSSGGFVPAAIPVAGEPFHNFGENAILQGSGSALRIDARPAFARGELLAEATFVVSDANFPDSNDNFGLSARAHVQYQQFLVGLTETAFADSDVLIPILDLAGPNGYATTLKPDQSGGQGRMSYLLYPFGQTTSGGLVGTVSLEMPTPEIRYTSGTTIPTMFAAFSHVPDFITTWKYREGHTDEKNNFIERRHVQVGAVFRDLGLKNGDKTISDSTFGWGLQISGSTEVDFLGESNLKDAVGALVIVGEGIGHYINDLHTQTIKAGPRGNDAVVNVDEIEALPAQAYYIGYVYRWTTEWQSSIGYSRVNLNAEPGQVAFGYRHGDYAVVNLVYSTPIPKDETNPDAPPKTDPTFLAGLEFLYGRKEVVDGRTENAQRMMFVLGITK